MVANFEIPRAADNFERAVACVHGHESYTVGTFYGGDIVHSSHHDVLETLTHVFDAFDHQPQVVENHCQLLGALREFNELAQPRK